MKKLVSILLCLAMLLSALAIFSSCNNEEEPPVEGLVVSEETSAIDMTGYSLIYSPDSSSASQNGVREFATQIQKKTGVSIKSARASSNTDFTGKKILVGNMAATQNALAGVNGHGWVIAVEGESIVIAGTTQIFTNMALAYFTENYLSLEGVTKREKVLTFNTTVSMNDVATVELASNGAYHYDFVYSDILDDEEGWAHVIPGNHSGGGSKDTVDMPVRISENLRDYLYSALKIKNAKSEIHSDATTVEKEILVGVTTRTEGIEVHNAISANQYGLFVKGNKIVVAAWNDEGISYAAELLKTAMTDAKYKDAEGNESLLLPADYAEVKTFDIDWVTDFPKPTDLQLAGTLSSADASLVYAYQGAGVNADAFNDYCEQLSDNGYVLVQKTTLDSNLFATYKNIAKGTTINVEYASAQNKSTMTFSYNLVEPYIDALQPTLRITSAPLSAVNLPTTELLDENSYFKGLKKTDSMITQVNVDYSKGDKGCFYIMTLEDGSFIIVDGATNENQLDEKLWNVLNNLYKKVWGTAPTADNPIHIRAWLLTHEHNDHYTVFKDFVKKYGKNNMLKFDYLLANFTSATQDYNAMQPSHAVYNDLATLKSYCSGERVFKYIKVHTGQSLYIQNVKIDILYTHQDMAPERQHFFNGTSTVFKTTIYNTNGMGVLNENGTQTFTILGDADPVCSVFLRGTYSNDTLHSDLVQVGHHGGFGCEGELYKAMTPTATFWALDAATTANTCAPANKDKVSLEYPTGYYVMHKLKGHLYAFMADGYSTTVTLGANGALYDAADLYDANFAPDDDRCDDIVYDNRYVVDVYEKYGGESGRE